MTIKKPNITKITVTTDTVKLQFRIGELIDETLDNWSNEKYRQNHNRNIQVEKGQSCSNTYWIMGRKASFLQNCNFSQTT